MATGKSNNGYLRVRICRDARPVRWSVHRLVLTAFKRAPVLGEEACHINGNRTDNRITNLRWATHRENERDKLLHGTAQVGESHSRLKLSESAVLDIRRRYVKRVVTCKALASEYGVDPTLIHKIVQRKCWTHI